MVSTVASTSTVASLEDEASITAAEDVDVSSVAGAVTEAWQAESKSVANARGARIFFIRNGE